MFRTFERKLGPLWLPVLGVDACGFWEEESIAQETGESLLMLPSEVSGRRGLCSSLGAWRTERNALPFLTLSMFSHFSLSPGLPPKTLSCHLEYYMAGTVPVPSHTHTYSCAFLAFQVLFFKTAPSPLDSLINTKCLHLWPVMPVAHRLCVQGVHEQFLPMCAGEAFIRLCKLISRETVFESIYFCQKVELHPK